MAMGDEIIFLVRHVSVKITRTKRYHKCLWKPRLPQKQIDNLLKKKKKDAGLAGTTAFYYFAFMVWYSPTLKWDFLLQYWQNLRVYGGVLADIAYPTCSVALGVRSASWREFQQFPQGIKILCFHWNWNEAKSDKLHPWNVFTYVYVCTTCAWTHTHKHKHLHPHW